MYLCYNKFLKTFHSKISFLVDNNNIEIVDIFCCCCCCCFFFKNNTVIVAFITNVFFCLYVVALMVICRGCHLLKNKFKKYWKSKEGIKEEEKKLCTSVKIFLFLQNIFFTKFTFFYKYTLLICYLLYVCIWLSRFFSFYFLKLFYNFSFILHKCNLLTKQKSYLPSFFFCFIFPVFFVCYCLVLFFCSSVVFHIVFRPLTFEDYNLMRFVVVIVVASYCCYHIRWHNNVFLIN